MDERKEEAGDVFVNGLLTTGFGLLGMFMLSGRFERQIPEEERQEAQQARERQRKKDGEKTATLKITFTEPKK
jgi:hypothetical protein